MVRLVVRPRQGSTVPVTPWLEGSMSLGGSERGLGNELVGTARKEKKKKKGGQLWGEMGR